MHELGEAMLREAFGNSPDCCAAHGRKPGWQQMNAQDQASAWRIRRYNRSRIDPSRRFSFRFTRSRSRAAGL